MKIGFIGLGIMGKPMVHNLIKAGYTDVLVWNRNQSAIDTCVGYGAVSASLREIGESCDANTEVSSEITKGSETP